MKKRVVVFTNGCFDIIHPGHIKILRKAKSLGDILIVGMNTDSSVGNIKPGRPINSQLARKQVLEAIRYVDKVILFNEYTPVELIKKIRPDILVKGADYRMSEIAGREFVKKVVRVPLEEGYSTTKIIDKIMAANGDKEGSIGCPPTIPRSPKSPRKSHPTRKKR